MQPGMPPLPLVGRTAELDALRAAFDAAEKRHGQLLLIRGASGIGKTRLVQAAVEEGARRGWAVAGGNAYAVEAGIPYALLSDALQPVLRRLDSQARVQLMAGLEPELAFLFPGLSGTERQPTRSGSAEDFRHRLLWNFAEFLHALASRGPLLITLDDLQWADASSLELLHFLVRQIAADPIVVLGAINHTLHINNSALRAFEASCTRLELCQVFALAPLSSGEVEEMVRKAFTADASVIRPFAALLFGWTRGNPFFLEQTLQSLVASGRLRIEHGGWSGWHLDQLELPNSVREVVLTQIGALSQTARSVVELCAVIGSRVSYATLEPVLQLPADQLVAGLEELCRDRILVERLDGDELRLDFTHPIVRETLYSELSEARRRHLHVHLAVALEQRFGARAEEHADELAYHYSRGHSALDAGKAIRYLIAASEAALGKYSNREAVAYLSGALERLGGATSSAAQVDSVIVNLARAHQRLGDYAAAAELWEAMIARAQSSHDLRAEARAQARAGVVAFWSSRPQDAIAHYDAGLAQQAGGDAGTIIRLKLAKCIALLEVGSPTEAQAEGEDALELAGAGAPPAVLARIHRTLLLVHIYIGPPERAREHGTQALTHAQASGELALMFWAHWGLAFHAGLTGQARVVAQHLAETDELAEQLNSPLLRLWSAEIRIEYHAAYGEWDKATALGAHAIRMARALNQRTLLPRLLVWTALVHLARGETVFAKELIDEAVEVSGAFDYGRRGANVDTVVPAHTGLAAYHLALGDYAAAIEVATRGLQLVDQTGYTVWGIHRLMPILAEAYLYSGNLADARRIGDRLRTESQRVGHYLGLAWADACDALLAWLEGDRQEGARLLEKAATALEAVPFVYDAARLRRQLAGRLFELGQRDAALRELRNVHDVLVELGAERELTKTREQIRNVGARPPARESNATGRLTATELRVARLVGKRKSNKAVAVTLGISVRTVSTHLSNIFRKLDIGTRAELQDRLHAGELDAPTPTSPTQPAR